jgi:dienelactone hydrolase
MAAGYSSRMSTHRPAVGTARRYAVALVLLAALDFSTALGSAPPRALPAGQVPEDVRLQPVKDLDGFFPFQPPATREGWEKRAERVRRQILVTQGLWPEPTRTPLNAVVHGRLEREGYTVDKVYFESLPGFFVTGNLYRPAGRTGKMPGVLCPHGHWADGRFMDQGVETVRREIANGAERFEEGGRSVLQARCVQLARMGCVVFHYDMIGYADSAQIPMAIAHGFSKQRPEMNTAENWGLFSPRAESHVQSVMGLQTWNSVRALDFLLSLPEVDSERVACTGASGGGTQTFILAAIDARVKVAFPAVMVGTAMQGGCTCENACGLRVNTGNVEFAALFAPKPLGMTSADDWTRAMSTHGYPELQQLYALFGAKDQVMLKRAEHFGHNYNHVSRTAMYGWMNRHLKLGLAEPVLEQDYKRLTREEMTVWDAQHPAPQGGPELERKLLRWLTDDAARQIQAAGASSEAFKRLAGPAVDVLIGRSLAEVGSVRLAHSSKREGEHWTETTGVLEVSDHHEALPVTVLEPRQGQARAVIWLDEAGKAGLFGDGGNLRGDVKRLLDAGITVVGVDLLFQGEFLADGKPVTTTRRVKNPRESAAYTFGYNPSLFAQRVHDVLSTIAWLRQSPAWKSVDLVGLGAAGPWAAAARAQAGAAVTSAAIDTRGFRFGQVSELQDVMFLPGVAKYADILGLLRLGAPSRLWVAGESAAAKAALQGDYAAAGVPSNLAADEGALGSPGERAVAWLVGSR